MNTICSLLVLFLLLAPVVAQAATYHVSVQGSDGVPCGQAPRRTINGGIACMQSGDTLLLGPGTYQEMISDSGCNPGHHCVTPPSGTTIRAAQPGTVTLRTSRNGGEIGSLVALEQASTQQVRIEGLVLDAQGMGTCGSTWQSRGIQFVGVECMNAGQGFTGAGYDILYDSVLVHHIGGGVNGGKTCAGGSEPWEGFCHGFYFMTGGGTGQITIRNSRISDVNGYAVQTYVSGVRVENTATSDILYAEPRIMCVGGNCSWDGTTPGPGSPPPSSPAPAPPPDTRQRAAQELAARLAQARSQAPGAARPRLTTPGACTVR